LQESLLNTSPESQPAALDQDRELLHRLGYAQELQRRMSGFSNYAISLSIICILAGGITSFPVGLCSVGGASVGLGWPLMSLIALAFAATMAQVASAFPTAGGLYHWSSLLGGRGWGWATAWINLIGLILVIAAINVATVQFTLAAFAPWFGLDDARTGELLGILVGDAPVRAWLLGSGEGGSLLAMQLLAVALMTASHALFNHRGIELTTKLTDFSGYLILVVSVLLTLALLGSAGEFDWSRLITLVNVTGQPDGAAVWPRTESLGWAFALGLLLPAYTITGFDASAHTAEETVGAATAVPRGILQSVLVSGLMGWVMLIAVILAIPDMHAAVQQGSNAFFWILEQRLPGWLRFGLLAGICLAQYLCGLAALTSTSRMVFAFARDGGLPRSSWLRQVSKRFRTPAVAIWIAAAVSVAITGLVPYLTITAVAVVFVYVSYLMPTLAGLRAYGRSWTAMGPWDIGGWYRPLGVLCLVAGVALIGIGVQPPNEIGRVVIPGTVLGLAGYWWAWKRKHFQGPPQGELSASRRAEIAAEERALEG
jgi:amino acid transporter